MSSLTATEVRLQNRADRREVVRRQAEDLLGERDGENLSETDQKQLTLYREELSALDVEIGELLADKEANDAAAEQSKLIRKAMLGAGGVEEDGPVYRSMAEYARDVILTRDTRFGSKLRTHFGQDAGQEIQRAEARLKLLRDPANTLSSNVAGLQPPQHIDQIFQVINKSRPIVDSAERSTLQRGTLTYPKVTQGPVVGVQETEKTEGGNQGMTVAMETAAASTYIGGGDLSWQAINWSTPDALALWFNWCGGNYALQTEQDAAQVITDDGQGSVLGTTFNATSGTFANLLTAIGAGAAAVFDNTGRDANTVYMSVDAYWYIFTLTSTAFAQFAQIVADQVGPLRFVRSRGLDDATVIVGDSTALLVAETDGAPVELNVVEPAIGGVEVGLIGAFEAVVADPGAFCLISAAS